MKLTTLPQRIKAVRSDRLATMVAGSWRTSQASSTERGYGSAWQKARASFLQRHPLCIFCERGGRVQEATVVDHVVPHRGDRALFWDRDNWQSMCKPCHDGAKRTEENRQASCVARGRGDVNLPDSSVSRPRMAARRDFFA